MTDDILLKYENPAEKRILFTARTGSEMEDATHHRIPIYTYSDLCKYAKTFGPVRMLAHLFMRSNDMIVLLQDPKDMNSGHWFSVSRNLPKRDIYFFSTYGGKPDVEKVKWMAEDDLHESGQFLNIFNDALRVLQQHGWTIHYNDYPYQKPNDKTAVCGIYTAAFLMSGANPDEFEKETKELMKRGINPAIYYYNKYFKHRDI